MSAQESSAQNPVRKHAYTTARPAGPAAPEPDFAERARTLVGHRGIATLSTLSHRQEGFPFGSLMPYAIDEAGRPIFLISSMAVHTKNLQVSPRASLFRCESETEGQDPLGASRATLVGNALSVSSEELAGVREIYLSAHENARYWVDFEDFSFYRLEVEAVYFVGGFGVMGWVDAADYGVAQVDPLAEAARGILDHMNADHADALLLLAKHFAGASAESAEMTSVDRLGFQVRLSQGERTFGARVGFLREVGDSGQCRKVLVEMVRQARSQGPLKTPPSGGDAE